MITSVADERIKDVRFTDDDLVVSLADGRTLTVPLVWYPRLLDASAEERNDWELIGDGEGIHWPQIDEDLSGTGLLRAVPAPGSRAYKERRSQERAVVLAREFYGDSLAQVKGLLESSRSQLEEYLETLSGSQGEVRSRIQQLVDSFKPIEEAINRSAWGLVGADVADQVLGEARGTARQAGQEEGPV